MAKTTIDGILQVPSDSAEFIIGGGTGKIRKFKTTELKVKQDASDKLLKMSTEVGTGSTIIKGKDLTSSNQSISISVGADSIDLTAQMAETPIVKVPDTMNFWTDDALHMEHTGTHVFSGDVEFKSIPKGLPSAAVQSIEIVDLVRLTGNNYTSNTAVLTQTLMKEGNTQNYVVKHRLVSYGTFTFPANSSNTKSTTLSLQGLFSSGQYVFCDELNIEGWTVSGGSNLAQHNYRIDQTKRQTNNLSVVANGTTNGGLIVAATIVIEFHLPNEDYGLGVPFPEFAKAKYTGKHQVYTE